MRENILGNRISLQAGSLEGDIDGAASSSGNGSSCTGVSSLGAAPADGFVSEVVPAGGSPPSPPLPHNRTRQPIKILRCLFMSVPPFLQLILSCENTCFYPVHYDAPVSLGIVVQSWPQDLSDVICRHLRYGQLRSVQAAGGVHLPGERGVEGPGPQSGDQGGR